MMGKKNNEKKEKSEKKAIFCRCPIERKKIAELLFQTSQLGVQSNS